MIFTELVFFEVQGKNQFPVFTEILIKIETDEINHNILYLRQSFQMILFHIDHEFHCIFKCIVLFA